MTDLLFEIDTSGETSRRSSRLFYTTIGSLENADNEQLTKPSQDIPAILKCKSKRYHEQDKLKKFIPGKISEQLRKALGLRRHDIPQHIYRMRHLGYPPGWLRKAEVISEGITIFGADNTFINSKQENSNVKYDWEKLHEYPGFNSCRFYDSRYDMCNQLGYMPMQEDCLLENFKMFLRNSRMLGKEATDIWQMRSANSQRNSETDFNLPAKRKLPQATSTPSSAKFLNNTQMETTNELSDGEIIEDLEPPMKRNFITEDGTILIPTSSQQKPSLDRFSEGINEHRLFENLPNARGTYKKVRDILMRNKF